jgi:hypothetical protein
MESNNKSQIFVLTSDHKKQLINDIEANGGLKLDNFLRICNTDPSHYGLRGSDKRRAFQTYLRNLNRQAIQFYWKNSILQNDVTPSAQTSTAYKDYINKMSFLTDDDETSLQSEEEEEDDQSTVVIPFKRMPVSSPAPVPKHRLPKHQPLKSPAAPKSAARFHSPSAKFSAGKAKLTSPNAADGLGNLVQSLESLHFHGTSIPYGNGSASRPIYIVVDFTQPERNDLFLVHHFPAMRCNGFTRNVVEIGRDVFVGDLQGDLRWQACVPTVVPAEFQSRVIDVKGPSVPYPNRNPTRFNQRCGLNCQASETARHQAIMEILDDPERKFIHYRFVFPWEIDHRIFNDHLDMDNDVHMHTAGIRIGANDAENTWTDVPLSFAVVNWRVGQMQDRARCIGHDQRTVDTQALFN